MDITKGKVETLSSCCRYSLMAYKKQHYVVVKQGKKAFISFRGSSSLKDIKEVMRVMPFKTNHGLVHKGIFDEYKRIRHEVFTEDALKNVDHIHFAGHSRGGSIALLMALDLSPHIQTSCYTYGSPPMADTEFYENSKQKIDDLICVEMKNDIIPHLPLNPLYDTMPNKLILDSSPSYDIIKNHSCIAYARGLFNLYMSLD